MLKKIVLIQVWIGEIPNYFWYHYETTKNLENIDFLFFTDQDLILESSNYRVIKISKSDVEILLSQKLNTKIEIKSNKKICDVKAAYGDLFDNFIKDYDFFGCYDIDTLFGDVNEFLTPLLDEFEYISTGDPIYHNRLSGPFLIMKNEEKFRKFYISQEFIDCFNFDYVTCYEENYYSQRVFENFKVKLITNTNFDFKNSGKVDFEVIWNSQQLKSKTENLFLYHFYHKKRTKFNKVGNIITAQYDKTLLSDFIWVVPFTENYEGIVKYLIESVKKYSNRKCLLYSINYNPTFVYETQFISDQFIFKRYDIEPGLLDERGRDFNVLTCKPKIFIDSLESYPHQNLVFIDSDILLTTNSDDISSFFNELENYPLVNSHIHDRILVSGVYEGQQWTDSLQILFDAEELNKSPIFPRKKTNVVVFNKKCKWFFEEQIKLYDKYFGSDVKGILSLHDEDTCNFLLTKHDLKNSLPLLDIEESYNLDVEKIRNYSYNMTNISEFVKLPKSVNEVLFFHGFKSTFALDEINNEYGNSVLTHEDIIIDYNNDTVFFIKNTFLTDKLSINLVDFNLKTLDNNLIFSLENQLIRNYWTFYISNIYLDPSKTYKLEILNKENGHIIYKNNFKIK